MSSPVYVTLVGNVTDDPDLKFLPSGAAVVKFGVAVNERKKNAAGEWEDAGTSFYRVTAWRQLAENIAESIRKGARVVVHGALRMSQYEKDGEKRTAWDVTADAVGAELSYATATVKKMSRASRDEVPPDDPWATASRTRPEPVPAY